MRRFSIGTAIGHAFGLIRRRPLAVFVWGLLTVAPILGGFALILPGILNIPIALGTIVGWIWMKSSPESHKRHCITLASGFIGGEALIAGLVLPILFYFGIL